MDRKRCVLAQGIRFGSISGLTLLLTAAWTGCGKDSGPTQPANLLRVTTLGSLTASSDSVSAFEAATTFNGDQIAFNHCDLPCRTLELRRPISSTRGSHTLGIQLLSQSCDPSPCSGLQTYKISGEVIVYDSSGKLVQQVPLAEKTLQLSATDVVTYPIDVNP
jgi:hypothetical protein